MEHKYEIHYITFTKQYDYYCPHKLNARPYEKALSQTHKIPTHSCTLHKNFLLSNTSCRYTHNIHYICLHLKTWARVHEPNKETFTQMKTEAHHPLPISQKTEKLQKRTPETLVWYISRFQNRKVLIWICIKFVYLVLLLSHTYICPVSSLRWFKVSKHCQS